MLLIIDLVTVRGFLYNHVFFDEPLSLTSSPIPLWSFFAQYQLLSTESCNDHFLTISLSFFGSVIIFLFMNHYSLTIINHLPFLCCQTISITSTVFTILSKNMISNNYRYPLFSSTSGAIITYGPLFFKTCIYCQTMCYQLGNRATFIEHYNS